MDEGDQDAAAAQLQSLLALDNEQLMELASRRIMDAADQKLREDEEETDIQKFYGANFGLGPALVFGLNSIKSAKKVGSAGNERVLVTEKTKHAARVLLEWHYLFQRGTDAKGWGHGPFVALALGDESVLDGLGLGYMLAVRRGDASFGLGYGYLFDNKVTKLADGFVDGQPLPTGFDDVLLVEDSQVSPMAVLSWTWSF